MKSQTQVLIVGAGPTGLTLAIRLRQAGIDHLLIDRLAAGQNLSRAGVIHAHTLEMLEPLGVVPPMLAAGMPLTRFAVRDRRRRLLAIDFAALPSSYPFVLMLPQDVTERILSERLTALGGTVHRGVEAIDVAQDVDGATVRVAPLPGERYRIVAAHRHFEGTPDRASIQQLLDTRGPEAGGVTVRDVHWSSAFRVQHRVADHYRDGRLIVMGDAAHVHSPAGGQGMNTGIVDAVLLGDLLARVVAGREPETLLDHYGEQRRPAAEAVLAMSGRLTRLALVGGPVRRSLRNLLLRMIDRVPRVKAKIALQLSGIARRRWAVARPPSASRT